MPDSNNPLETTLRNIKDAIIGHGLVATEEANVLKKIMTKIRVELINFRNMESK